MGTDLAGLFSRTLTGLSDLSGTFGEICLKGLCFSGCFVSLVGPGAAAAVPPLSLSISELSEPQSLTSSFFFGTGVCSFSPCVSGGTSSSF